MLDRPTDPGATGATPAAGTGAPAGATPTGPATPASGSASSAGATPTAGATPATEPTPTTPAATSSAPSGLESALKAERDRATKAEKALKELQDRDLSETEKLRNAVKAHEAEIAARDTREKAAKIKMATISAAAKRGFADPEDAFRLLDSAAIVLDEGGEPTNVPKLLDDLIKAKPYLAASSARASGSADLGGGNGSAAFSKEALAKMSPQQIADNWDKIVAGTGGKIPS